MDITALLIISCCGGCGAVARFIADTLIKRTHPTVFPVSTLIINTIAAILFAASLVFVRESFGPVYTYMTAGFLGGFSTFSTAMNEIVTLARSKHWAQFISYFIVAIAIPVIALILSIMVFMLIH
ncbi:fluoride efflux transporter FluC [Alloscardovia theropitheci]|nr:CrcB family protein [Alloscardovia theropitheci]